MRESGAKGTHMVNPGHSCRYSARSSGKRPSNHASAELPDRLGVSSRARREASSEQAASWESGAMIWNGESVSGRITDADAFTRLFMSSLHDAKKDWVCSALICGVAVFDGWPDTADEPSLVAVVALVGAAVRVDSPIKETFDIMSNR